ncbi:hypothetical protein N8T08_002567 [Aspergillus melleus]|uniref:Uncharacterized protein n=1 Tax=Aspergillus melleus TaxID=138277 RepID=A0ACC3B8X7_9EURO|nr:hypothetical protein N8T08_002567 [Aspergillus melleus]
MPEFIRYVSVYTGPHLYANLQDEYKEAYRRLDHGEYAVVHNDEDISPEDAYVRYVQLHSHLLFKVIVDRKYIPVDQVIRAAAFTASTCLGSEDPKQAQPIDPLASYTLRAVALHLKPELGRIVRVDCQRHPLFKGTDKPTTAIQPRRWTPADIDSQYSAYPKSCAEDKKSKKARHRRRKAWGSHPVTFHRNSVGDVDIVVQRPDKNLRYMPWTSQEADQVNY